MRALHTVPASVLLLTLAACPLAAQTPAAAVPPSPAQPPVAAPTMLSPRAAYDEAMRPLDLTRRDVGNWSDAEVAALNLAIQQAASACLLRDAAQTQLDDLVDLARLCGVGQKWEITMMAAHRSARLPPETFTNRRARFLRAGSTDRMAKGVNKVLLLGNVGKDPEIRSSQGGMTIASFSLATADRQKDQTGQWVDKTEWHNLVAFGRTAEIIRDYVKKGTQLFVEGKIQTRSWDDKESGQKKYRTEILVNDMSLLGGRGGEGGSGGGNYERSSSGARGNTATYGGSGAASGPDYADQGITDEDIPF